MVSTASVLGFLYILVVVVFDFDWTAMLVRYFVPLLFMNYWLVMVTYLQHHEGDTNVSCAYSRHLKRRKWLIKALVATTRTIRSVDVWYYM